jgi:soluble lytic murein transglycosylase-like protein
MRLRARISIVFLAAVFTTGGSESHAQDAVYRCISEDGVPLFTNVPGDRRCTLVMKPARQATAASPTRITAATPARRGSRRTMPDRRQEFEEHVLAAAKQHDVEPALIHAVISAESGYDPKATSGKGARGLMQLIPATGARYGAKDLLDPKQNIDAGTRYLKDLMAMFGQDLRLAVAAYNAGEGAVLRYGTIPPYAETRAYVPRVLAYYRRYRDASAATRSLVQRANKPR